jgi:hypothetical protein
MSSPKWRDKKLSINSYIQTILKMGSVKLVTIHICCNYGKRQKWGDVYQYCILPIRINTKSGLGQLRNLECGLMGFQLLIIINFGKRTYYLQI